LSNCRHKRIFNPKVKLKVKCYVCDKELLELGGEECDKLNFMNFKIGSLKIRKNS